jgi:hypothetical protein
MDIASPEWWGFGVGTAILLIALAYGAWRAGWLSRSERGRTDAATLENQRRVGMRPAGRFDRASGSVGVDDGASQGGGSQGGAGHHQTV